MLSNQSGLEEDRVIAVLLHDINTQERRNFRIVSLMGSGEQHLTYLVEDPAAGCHAVLKWHPHPDRIEQWHWAQRVTTRRSEPQA